MFHNGLKPLQKMKEEAEDTSTFPSRVKERIESGTREARVASYTQQLRPTDSGKENAAAAKARPGFFSSSLSWEPPRSPTAPGCGRSREAGPEPAGSLPPAC